MAESTEVHSSEDRSEGRRRPSALSSDDMGISALSHLSMIESEDRAESSRSPQRRARASPGAEWRGLDDNVMGERQHLPMLLTSTPKTRKSLTNASVVVQSKPAPVVRIMDLDDFGSDRETGDEAFMMQQDSSFRAASTDSSDRDTALQQLGIDSATAYEMRAAALIDSSREEEVAPISPARRHSSADWWTDADPGSVRDLQAVQVASYLTAVNVVRHAPMSGLFGSAGWTSKEPAPWHAAGESSELYRSMGMRNPKKQYMSLWLNMNRHSLLAVSEVLDVSAFNACLSGDCLSKSLKLIMNPVNLRVPIPMKRPADVRPLGVTFGGKNVSLTQQQTKDGVKHACLQVDLFSKFVIRCGIQQVGIPAGSQIDILVVDWPRQVVLAAFRLMATPHFQQLVASS